MSDVLHHVRGGLYPVQGDAGPVAHAPALIDVQQVTRRYPLARQGLWEPRRTLTALDRVSLTVRPGSTLGVVGESGSGKSTLTRCLLGLEPVDGGRILYRGQDIAVHDAHGRRSHAARMQVVFQDPNASMNPRMTVHDIVAEGMVIHQRELGMDSAARSAQVIVLLGHVGLGRDHLHRYPHELSGGQRQRVYCPRTGPQAGMPDPRRTDLGTGCVGAGAGAEPAARDAADLWLDLPVCLARPGGGALPV